MENHREHIDDLLFSHLNDASADGEGIDWNSFKQRRRKRRLVWWFFFSLGILFLLGLSGLGIYWWNKPDASAEFGAFNPQNSRVQDSNPSISRTKDPKTEETFEAAKEMSLTHPKTKTMFSAKIRKASPVQNKFLPPSAPVEENFPAEENAPLLPETREAISLSSRNIPRLFHYTYPQYTAEKVPYLSLPAAWPKIKKQDLYWEIQAGPAVNIPHLEVTSSGRSFVHKDYEYIRKSSESAVSGYNLQVAFGKSVKRWRFSVGIGYTKVNLRGDYHFQYSEKPVIDTDGKIKSYLQSSPADVQFFSKQGLSFLEVPVSAQWICFERTKFAAGLRLGYVSQFLNTINGQIPNAVFLDTKETLTTENFKTRTSSVQGGLQFMYKMDPRSALILQPEFRWGLGFRQVQSHYKTGYRTWGLNLTYRMAL